MTGNVFGNPKLASELYQALAHVAAHYKSVDYIAAYEPLSEPRWESVITLFLVTGVICPNTC